MEQKKQGILEKPQTLIWALGIGHGFSDATAGYLMGTLAQEVALSEVALAVVIYNILAFGGQFPLGIYLDHLKYYRSAAILALVGMIMACICMGFQIWVGTVLAGVSSAIFHVAGGGITLRSFPQKASYMGIFSAFGVFGLALGGWAGATQVLWIQQVLVVGLGMVAFLVLVIRMPEALPFEVDTPKTTFLDTHDYLMILLMVAIAARSAIWNYIQLLYNHQYEWLLYIALAAMVGKLLGGWLSDHVGMRLYALVSLAMAIVVLSWGHRKLIWLMIGTGLLQSITPVSVIALQRAFPQWPATMSGAAFGLAIALGGSASVFSLGKNLFYLPQLFIWGMGVWLLYFYAFKLHKKLFSI